MNHNIVVFIIVVVLSASLSTAQDLPDTGLVNCYDSTTAMTACPDQGEAFYGQDSQYQGAKMAYEDHSDGTITDMVTGVMWQQSYHLNQSTYDDACKYCDDLTLAGYQDWYLPDIVELTSIIDFSTANVAFPKPAIHSLFDSAQSDYWSKTSAASDNDSAWYVDFEDSAGVSVGSKSNAYYVRCARKGSYTAQISIFEDNADGTISDKGTGLMWQQTSDGTERSWEDALAYCEACTDAGYSDWRLPNIRDLLSIVAYDGMDPAIDTGFFTSVTDDYWSSSSDLDFWSYAKLVDFHDGEVQSGEKKWAHHVRCVRGGQVQPSSTCEKDADNDTVGTILDFSNTGMEFSIENGGYTLTIQPIDMTGTNEWASGTWQFNTATANWDMDAVALQTDNLYPVVGCPLDQDQDTANQTFDFSSATAEFNAINNTYQMVVTDIRVSGLDYTVTWQLNFYTLGWEFSGAVVQ